MLIIKVSSYHELTKNHYFLCRVIRSLSSTFALPTFLFFCVITPDGDAEEELLLDIAEEPDSYASAITTVTLMSSR